MILMTMILLFVIPSVFCIEPSSIIIIEGTYNNGDLDSMITEYDNDYYDVSETTGVPALDIRINFTDVTVPFYFAIMRAWHTGTGGSGHEAYLQLWNYTSSSWDNYNRFYDSFRFWEETSLIPNYQHYVSEELIQSRIIIEATGNVNHDFLIDYIYLSEEPTIGYDVILISILALVIAIFSFLFVIILTQEKR